ncbi:MAG: beta-propeller fold lactonase family protein [Bacillota bacterium]|uniref:40-residue YVTN family beta-propeller n=1 Tax=Cytobacillus oceanisediminis 2691 TaxID=1196031 RepID=A0A169G377_9BACI|nr:YncE family protein [Cytobacillus oceanisediminis]AND43035.1 40-residue YVTN family beta-propeller [Cytobacillus oceanisediminis 2691]MCM3244587.1 YncE family protein [Cytobacillus oceanisediminis]
MSNIKKSVFIFLLLLGAILAGCSSASNAGEDKKSEEEPVSKVENKEREVDGNKEKADEKTAVQYYFTANEGGSISKIDAANNSIVSTIEVDGSVHNVQVSPDGKMIGVTVVPSMAGHGGEDDGHGEEMEMGAKAIFYSIENDELLQEVEVGNHPAHIVFSEDGKYAAVTNNEDNNVTVIDMPSFNVINTVETGKGPHGFRISSDSKRAYIANMGEDTVSVVNLETMKEEKRIKVGTAPVTTGVTSDGKTLVATLNGENALAVVDLATDKVDKIPVGTGPAQVYIDEKDQFAYVANQGTEEDPSSSVTVIDLIAKKATTEIKTGKGSHGVVTSPDNKRVYVTNMFEDTVSIIDKEQNKVIQTIEVKGVPNGISITN